LVTKSNDELTDLEKGTILVHYYCKCLHIQQISNSGNIDKIELPELPKEENALDYADYLLERYYKNNLTSNKYFIKMFIDIDYYLKKGIDTSEIPILFESIQSDKHKTLSKIVEELAKQYERVFNMILDYSEKNEYFKKKIYTINDLNMIAFDGEEYFKIYE
jgi:hypothetical protein